MNKVFNATLDAVSTNKTKTVIKLSLSNKEAAIFAQRYLASVDKELRVSFDDPQMEMDIQPSAGGRGLMATIDNNGVVETVKHNPEDYDDNGDLFEQNDLSDDSDDEEGNSSDPDELEEDDNDPNGDDDSEVEFTDSDQLEPSADDDDDQEDGSEAPDAEAIEEYILSEKPEFVEVPYNFAELLRRRREEDVRWIDLARGTGVSSSKLQSAYQTYKKLVVKQMRQQQGVS